jgi:hypothetical protein
VSNIDLSRQTPLWGLLAFVTGAVALVLAMVVIFAGPFAPQPTVGTTIGEIAGDMLAAARRSVEGAPPPAPQPRGWDIDRVLVTITPILGVAAVVLAMVAVLRHERRHLPSYAAALGISAIVFQFFWWVALLICGVVLLVAIIENLGGFVEGFGG